MSMRSFVLSNVLLRELYFFIKGKKLNRKVIDKKISKLMNFKSSGYVISDLVVSLTTFGERIPELKYTLYSLITQSILPEKIIVWVSKSEEDIAISQLNSFRIFNIDIRSTKDIRSYKKLIPALQEFENKFIVTCDDDIFYKRNWLKKLWFCHLQNPDCIVTHIAHKVSFDKNKQLITYNKWKHNVERSNNSYDLFPTGGGGTLYHYSLLHKDVSDEKLFMTLCPMADDVWFYFMELLNNTKVVVVPKPYNQLKYVDIYKEYGLNSKKSLQITNVGHSMNDTQIRAVMEHYGLSDKSLFQKIYG